MIKASRIIIGVGLLGLTACCPYYDDDWEETRSRWTDATVVDMGAPEVDGCGWLVLIEDEYYYPVNLADELRSDGLEIEIRYYYDPIEYRCGLGGTRIPSIRITAYIFDTDPAEVRDLVNWDSVPMDMFRMDSAFVEGDSLHLQISYSGGCRHHEFALWRLMPDSTPGRTVCLMLSHEDNGDMCEAYITEWMAFSLRPLRERGKREIPFLLRGSPEMSAYFGEFAYKY